MPETAVAQFAPQQAPGTKMQYADDDEVREAFLGYLRQVSGASVSADEAIAYHADPPNKISLPQGMTAAKGAEILADVATALAQKEVFSRTFKYRPFDGAHAVTSVLRKFFGTSGRGVPIKTMFGSIPPQQIEIEVDQHGHTEQVPWGHVAMSHLEGKLMLSASEDTEYGTLFTLSVDCPKRYGQEVAGFFTLVEHELRTNSIYKGKSIKGTDQPRFIPTGYDDTIVYAEDVESALNATVWGVIQHAALLKEDKKKVNKRVLLEGPYGTGKSEAGRRTASVANDNGWTFIQFQSGKSNLEELEKTIQTARLYAPAVVFIEDIDIYAGVEGVNSQTRITNLFDGIGTKGDQVMIVMTSNVPAAFSKGMLRAGRVDRMIHIGELDKNGVEQLVRRVIGEHRLDSDIDFEAVHVAMEGFEPAFVRSTFDQAAEAALIRTGSRDYKVGTNDLVTAATLLRPQHELHSGKSDERKVLVLDTMFRGLVADVVSEQIRIELLDEDGDLRREAKVTKVEP